MKYLFFVITIFLYSCQKQESLFQDKLDTVILKSIQKEQLINVEIDTNFIDTVIIKIEED